MKRKLPIDVIKKLSLLACFGLAFLLQAKSQSQIYFTAYSNPPASPASQSSNNVTYSTAALSGWTGYSAATYPAYALTTSSAGQVTLTFSTPYTLNSNGSDRGKIIVHWGATANRPLNIFLNGTSTTTQIDAVASSGERSVVRTIEYDIPNTTTTLSSVKLGSSGGSGVYFFDIEIQTHSSVAPTTQASGINFNNVGPTSFTANWTRGNGAKVAVFMKEGAGAITNPVNGTDYTASADWGSKGSQLGASGYYCIYNGSATTVNVSNLLPSTSYTLQAFEYNGTGATTLYNVSTAANNPNSQTTSAATPTINAIPSALAFGGVKTGTTAEMSYSLSAVYLNPTNGNITVTAPSGYLVSTTSGSGYASSILVPYTGSTLAATTIYVQFAPTAFVSYPGNVANTGGSAPAENVAVSGTGVQYSVGDIGSVANGSWSSASTWKKWDGLGWNTTGTVPTATDNVYITNNAVVTLTGTGNFKNLTVESGQLKGDNTGWPTGTTRALTPADGGFITVNGGILGATNVDNTETNIALTGNGDFTLNGTGGIVRVSRIRCNNIAADMDIHINRDLSLTYTGSSGNGGMAINSVTSSGNSPGGTKTFFIGAGATVNLLNFGYLGAETSASGDAKLNTNFVINGVLNANGPNNILNLRTQAGFSNSLTVGPTGVANIGGLTINGPSAAVTLVNNGVLNLGSSNGGTIDFTNTAGDMYITGTGATNLLDGATILIGANDGITASAAAGPFRTSSRSYGAGANYTYNSAAVQNTGDGLTGANNLINANGSNTLLVTNPVVVTGAVMFGNVNNTVLSAGGNLTLRSTATKTALIADLTNGGVNTGNSISGNVTVERYVPANGRRAWRLLGANVTALTAPTIKEAWQEGGLAVTSGTHITQASGAGTNGFDASSIANASSIRYWNGTSLLTPANTDVTKITDNGGAYFLFVRGNRTIDLNNGSASSNTTLRQAGTVNQGDLTGVGVAGATTSLIPNPYPSPVDYEAVYGTNAFSTYYVWDANLGTTGAYRTIERTGANTYQSTPSTGSVPTDNEMRYIRSGQAFFVSGNTTFNFTESMKTDMTPTTNVYRTGAGVEEMTIDLKVVGTTTFLADGVRAKYSNSYNNAVNSEDIAKFNNFNENLGIERDNLVLAVEKRDLVDASDTIFLKLWNTGIKNYQFDINASNFSPAANLEAFLKDAYLNTTTPVSLSGNTVYNFSVTSDANSAATARFMIVYRPSTPLPVKFTNVKAFQKNSGIQVEWNVGTEQDVVKYEVEKSTNGTTFDKAGTVVANHSKAYTWFDANPVQGGNFYRIKVINKDNSYQYSQVVNVKIENTNGDIAVYPNPVKGGVINLQFTNLEKGTYTVQLTNSLGQQVYSGRIVHNGGSATESLQAGLTKGVYQMTLTNGTTKTTLQVVAE